MRFPDTCTCVVSEHTLRGNLSERSGRLIEPPRRTLAAECVGRKQRTQGSLRSPSEPSLPRPPSHKAPLKDHSSEPNPGGRQPAPAGRGAFIRRSENKPLIYLQSARGAGRTYGRRQGTVQLAQDLSRERASELAQLTTPFSLIGTKLARVAGCTVLAQPERFAVSDGLYWRMAAPSARRRNGQAFVRRHHLLDGGLNFKT